MPRMRAKHELIRALADLNHAILKPCADLLFGMLHERVVQHPDDCAERDYGHQQKNTSKFFGQGHGGQGFILTSRIFF